MRAKERREPLDTAKDFEEKDPFPIHLNTSQTALGSAAITINKCEMEKGWGGLGESLLFALFLIHFLHFHPPVLKPDFDLSLTQIEESGHFVPTVPGEVHIEQKLLL